MKKRMLGSVTLAVKDLVIRTEPESAMMSYHRLGRSWLRLGEQEKFVHLTEKCEESSRQRTPEMCEWDFRKGGGEVTRVIVKVGPHTNIYQTAWSQQTIKSGWGTALIMTLSSVAGDMLLGLIMGNNLAICISLYYWRLPSTCSRQHGQEGLK